MAESRDKRITRREALKRIAATSASLALAGTVVTGCVATKEEVTPPPEPAHKPATPEVILYQSVGGTYASLSSNSR